MNFRFLFELSWERSHRNLVSKRLININKSHRLARWFNIYAHMLARSPVICNIWNGLYFKTVVVEDRFRTILKSPIPTKFLLVNFLSSAHPCLLRNAAIGKLLTYHRIARPFDRQQLADSGPSLHFTKSYLAGPVAGDNRSATCT